MKTTPETERPMKTKWQRQILAVIAALKEGATKCEQTEGRLFVRTDEEKPQACALGAVYIDGKNVKRIRSIGYTGIYREHPVLKTRDGDESTLGDEIITLNDTVGLSFAQIIAWLRKLARRKSAPKQWPSAE